MENIWGKFHLVLGCGTTQLRGTTNTAYIYPPNLKKKCFNNFFRKAPPKLIRLDNFRVF